MKHSQATKVEMSLTGNEISLIMMIEDNGKGFNMDQARSIGMGLKSMEKRMTDIGGKLVIDSKPGRGTIIVAEVNI
jgi:two-component system sensor histidine kinase DegS